MFSLVQINTLSALTCQEEISHRGRKIFFCLFNVYPSVKGLIRPSYTLVVCLTTKAPLQPEY